MPSSAPDAVGNVVGHGSAAARVAVLLALDGEGHERIEHDG
jgi:hypothetical protein